MSSYKGESETSESEHLHGNKASCDEETYTVTRGAGISIIGGQIFIYSCSAQLISFEIDCFYSL